MEKGKIRILVQVICWLAATVCLIYVVSFLTKRSNSVMKDKAEEGYVGIIKPEIENGEMTPEILLSLGKVSDPQLSPDGKYILYNISYTSIRDNKSCGNLYICRTDGTGRQQFTASGKSISNARWCPDGKKIAYLSDGQIHTATVRYRKGEWHISEKVTVSDVPGGISEFSISPDGTRIMYTSTVQSALKKPSDLYPDLDKSDAISADDLMYRHWDHWVKEIPHTFVADVAIGSAKAKSICRSNSRDILAGENELYELPAEPFGGINQLCWSPDGNFIAYSCKKLTGKKYAFSTNSEIYLYRVSDGNTIKVTDGGGYDTDPAWSPDGTKLCWLSMERDGYEADKSRLMTATISLDGGMAKASDIRELTREFKYNVSAPVWTDSSDEIYFSALAEGIQGIFKASLKDGKIMRITGDDLWYDFGSPFAITENEDGDTELLANWCSMNFPDELVSIKIGSGNADADNSAEDNVSENRSDTYAVVKSESLPAECEIIGNPVTVTPLTRENAHILDKLAMPETQARHITTVDGKEMLTWVVYPPEFDKTKTYPAILICLGGPQSSLSQGWSYRWNYRLMAAQGYVVVLPNRRGTTAFGQDWTEQISGDYCGLNIQDYLTAAKEIKAERYIGKMAACGASYGGYSVYYLCGVHGNTFDAFVAHAGIFNQEHMYMTTEEMWFPNWDNGGLHEYEADQSVGTAECPVGPAGDGETFGGIRQGGSPWSSAPKAVRHYANSPHKLVTNWHTPLLVMHGGMDFRVPSEQGMAAYNAAQMMGVPSRLILFPDENHWILKPQNALYWHREYFRWLDKWCK